MVHSAYPGDAAMVIVSGLFLVVTVNNLRNALKIKKYGPERASYVGAFVPAFIFGLLPAAVALMHRVAVISHLVS